jgi:hypothetical protein
MEDSLTAYSFKKIYIAYILSPICFYIGDYASKILRHKDSYFLAEIYQRCMAASAIIEDWCGKDIMWERVDE